jgi:hypothetical protein
MTLYQSIYNPRLKWLAAGALFLLGVGLLVIPGGLIEEIARRAMLGQLPAIKPFAPAAKYDLRFVALQLLAHFTVRACLFWVLPVERASALGNVWINLHFLVTATTNPQLLFGTVLLAWFAVSLLGLSTAPRVLRPAAPTLYGRAISQHCRKLAEFGERSA